MMKQFIPSLFFAINLIYSGAAIAKDYTTEQINLLQKQAKQGNPTAQIDLGLMYFRGDGISKDNTLAAYWFIKAAEQGSAVAQHYVGWIYAHGEGLAKHKGKALFWYIKSAKKGHVDSQNNVANIYLRGDGVEKDYRKASYWYRKAAEQGSQYAQYELAVMYQLGEGIEQDSKKAKELFFKSADQGNKKAKKALAIINIEDKADEYSKQRISDVYSIASLLGEYKEIAGHYPFYDPTPAQEGYVKTGTLVTIGSSIAEENLAKKPNPFHLSAAKAYSSHLRRELEQKLERKVELPVDPQEVDIYAPNAYYVYFPAKDDEYLILAFLYNSNSYTSELFNSHANVYAIASSPVVGEYRFWSSASIKPRIFKEIKSN